MTDLFKNTLTPCSLARLQLCNFTVWLSISLKTKLSIDFLIFYLIVLLDQDSIEKGKLLIFKKVILTLKYWSMVSDSKSRPSGTIGSWQINGFQHSMLSKTLTNIEKTWEKPPGIKLSTLGSQNPLCLKFCKMRYPMKDFKNPNLLFFCFMYPWSFYCMLSYMGYLIL